MLRLRRLALFGCVLVVACTTGKLKTVDTADQTPPDLWLSVTVLDADTQAAKSTTVKPGQTAAVNAIENTDIIIVATAKDEGGIKALRIWNIGAHLKNMAKGEVLGTPTAAYSTVSTQGSVHIRRPAGSARRNSTASTA